MKHLKPILSEERVIPLRGLLVILDSDLAKFFGTTTSRINEAVKRHKGRFGGEDFMFQLTEAEVNMLSQPTVSKKAGGRRTRPYAFTEIGCWTVSMILTSQKAESVGKELLKTFKAMKDYLQNQPSDQLSPSIQKLVKGKNTTINILYPSGPVNLQVGSGSKISQSFNSPSDLVKVLESLLPTLKKEDKELSNQVEKLVKAVESKNKTGVKELIGIVADSVNIANGLAPHIITLKAILPSLMNSF